MNSFLQMVEQDNSDSLIIAATNHVRILDRALFRRFDDVIEYDLPDKTRIVETLKAKLGAFAGQTIVWPKVATVARGLNFADITRACEDAIKDAIIHERTTITQTEIVHAVQDRKVAVTHKEHS